MRYILVVLLLVSLLSGCKDGPTSTEVSVASDVTGTMVNGAGVKGPLAGAVVRLYQIDLNASDLKGTRLGQGTTGADASINGLAISSGLSGLVLLEFSADADTIDISTGAAPVIDHLVTVVDVQRIYGGDDIYATPLTTMAVSLAQASADKGSPYAGNGDSTTTTGEFTAALAVAQNQVKSTLGFGLDSSIDIFTTPPIITAKTTTTTEQTQVARYRQAVEAVSALVDKVATDSTATDTPQEIFDGLTDDLKDGTIDGANSGTPVPVLNALDVPIDSTVGSIDPTTLDIPGTTTPVTDIEQVLVNEMSTTGQSTDTTALTDSTINVVPASPSLVAVSNATYSIGGSISGLGSSKSVVLQNNGGDDLTLSTNGNFIFVTPLADGGNYTVTVKTQPVGQTCTTASNTGTVNGATITNVVVSCSVNTYTVGGNISGLGSGNQVVLQNNSGDDLTLSANGTLTFATPVADGAAYNVTVKTQPTGQTCIASSNTGTVSGADVTTVAVNCTVNTYTIGGTVTGLTGSVIIQNNSGDDLTLNANGAFTFATSIADGGIYTVTVKTQPTAQTCTASSNSGTVSASDVTTVAVSCVNTYPSAVLSQG